MRKIKISHNVILFIFVNFLWIFFVFLMPKINEYYNEKKILEACSAKDSSTSYDKLMIVAHPDDELIFGYNLLKEEKGWYVIVMTNNQTDIRKKEFEALMKELKIDYYKMFDFYDDWTFIDWNKDTASKLLNEVIETRCNWDRVVTHGEVGEYGHPQHILTNEIVTNTYTGNNLYYFGSPFRDDDEFKLSETDIQVKHELLLKYYPSQYEGVTTSVWYEDTNNESTVKVR